MKDTWKKGTLGFVVARNCGHGPVGTCQKKNGTRGLLSLWWNYEGGQPKIHGAELQRPVAAKLSSLKGGGQNSGILEGAILVKIITRVKVAMPPKTEFPKIKT